MWFRAAFAVKSVVTIRHIFISPGHNFFGHHGQPAGEQGGHLVRRPAIDHRREAAVAAFAEPVALCREDNGGERDLRADALRGAGDERDLAIQRDLHGAAP